MFCFFIQTIYFNYNKDSSFFLLCSFFTTFFAQLSFPLPFVGVCGAKPTAVKMRSAPVLLQKQVCCRLLCTSPLCGRGRGAKKRVEQNLLEKLHYLFCFFTLKIENVLGIFKNDKKNEIPVL